MDGWIKLHRSVVDNWVWSEKPFSRGQAWLDLLIMANHKDNKFSLGGELVIVDRGSLITSEVKLMERWGWSKSKVRLFLDQLQSDSMLIKKADRKKTTLTIVNYGTYQESETTEKPIKDHQETTERPLKDTNKNVKNDKNVKKDIKEGVNRFAPPTTEEVREYCRQRNNRVDPERFIDFYSSKGWMVGKNKMKDWKAAVRTWEKEDKPKSQPPQKQNKFNQYPQRSYDYSELERKLINKGLEG